MGLQLLLYSIFALMFYYAMVFLVSTNVLFCHFETNIESSCIGIKWLLKYHMGSIVLCSLVLPLAKIFGTVIDFVSGKPTPSR